MVALNLGLAAGGGLVRCGSGHVAVVVTRGAGVRAACPECLNAAMKTVADRELTLSDYLARLEADGTPPQVSAGEGRAAAAMFEAAGELFNGHSAADCRRVVREVATACGLSAAEVMRWSLKTFRDRGLAQLQKARSSS